MQQLRIWLWRAFRRWSVLWICRQKARFVDLGRNSNTLVCSARRAPGRWPEAFLPPAAGCPAPCPTVERQCPVQPVWVLSASGDLWCCGIHCRGRGLGTVVENVNEDLRQLPAMRRENKAGARLQSGCFRSGSLWNRSVQMETRPAADTRAGQACRRLRRRHSLRQGFGPGCFPGEVILQEQLSPRTRQLQACCKHLL